MIFLQILISYLLGSIPSSVIAGKRRGIDIREHGSGNAGGTNTFRVLGWKAGVVVSIIDIGKGYLAATMIANLFPPPSFLGDELTQIACGFAAIIGHIWTVFADFRGGKGVATAAGMMIGLYPVAMAYAIGVFVIVLLLSRYVSLASIVGTATVPLFLTLEYHEISHVFMSFSILIFVLIVYTHRKNIRMILDGTERRVGKK
jgi:glycerol-3-phosphate acyltransferase PlsY